jgi:branched-chain amino acid transport system permease protein
VAALAGRRNVFALAGLALLVLPALANPYILYVANIALIYVILAVGLNLLLGYAGQFAFANAALFGIGAYATGLFQVKLGLPFWIAFPGAVLFTTLVGLVVALPALRLSGLYLALVTLAFAQLTQWLMLNWERVTFGAGGFKVPPLTFGRVSPALGLYYLTLLLAGLLVAGAWNTVRSGVGRALVAVRDSEVAAEALAIDLARYKAIAFSMSALYAGVAGGLYSAALSFVAPEGFDLSSRWSFSSAWWSWAASARYGARYSGRGCSSVSRRLCARSRAGRRSRSASCSWRASSSCPTASSRSSSGGRVAGRSRCALRTGRREPPRRPGRCDRLRRRRRARRC